MPRPTYGLEEVPRPVVAFLLGDCKLKPHEALTGCLRELADEGLVRYETDAVGRPVISLGSQAPRSGRPLLAFEQVALARVRARAERLPRVPFSALVSDEGDDYKNWVKEQEEELGQEARRAGMAVKSSPRGSWRALAATRGGPSGSWTGRRPRRCPRGTGGPRSAGNGTRSSSAMSSAARTGAPGRDLVSC